MQIQPTSVCGQCMATPVVTLTIKNAPTIILRKGANITLGRAEDCDIQFLDSNISRYHAKIRWKWEKKHPIISDNDSCSGIQVDDQYVGWKHIHHVHIVMIGNHKITAVFHPDKTQIPDSLKDRGIKIFPQLGPRYKKPKKKKPNPISQAPTMKFSKKKLQMPFTLTEEEKSEEVAALLKELDTVNRVTLFKHYGQADERGRVRNNRQLHELFVYMEEKEYTGTLTLISEHTAKLVFGGGKIVYAECGKLRGKSAVQHIFMFPNASFLFSYSCEVLEAKISISSIEWIKMMSKHATDSVSRPSKRMSKLFDEEVDIPTQKFPTLKV